MRSLTNVAPATLVLKCTISFPSSRYENSFAQFEVREKI
jgi:hypothetical protein